MTKRGTVQPATPVEATSVKKAYEPPVLRRYGTLTELTRTTANSGMLDGGAFSLRTGGSI